MAAVIRQMLPSFSFMREGGQENPEPASVSVRSTRRSLTQACLDNSCSNGINVLLLLPEELESFCGSLKDSGFKNNSSLGAGDRPSDSLNAIQVVFPSPPLKLGTKGRNIPG